MSVGEGAYSFYSWTEIALGAGARATVIETFLGATAAVQRHAATTVRLAKGAVLKHVAAIGDEAELHLESQFVELEAEAELNAFGFVSGGALTRRQIFAKVAGADAKIALGGLALIDGTRRADTTLEVVHAAPRGFSREFYRAIVADEAAGVFQGKIVVAPGAQKTDGAMKSQAVLLSPQAQMNAKPELEIFADDVICGHGATVASIDPEMIFYLQSRGIPKTEAEAMLLEAFGAEAIASVDDEALERRVEGAARRLARRPGRRDGRDDGDERVNDMVRPVEPYDVAKIREDFPILAERPYGKPLVYLDNAASAQKPKAVLDRLTYAYEHEYANVHRGLHYLANAATEAYEAARETVRRFLNAAFDRRDHLHPLRDRGDQPRRRELRPEAYRRRRRDRAQRDGASLEHRPVALPSRAEGRDPELDRDRRRRVVLDRRVRKGAERPDEDRRDHPDVERRRHGAADQGDRQDRACARDQGAGRRLAGRGPSRRRRARPRRGLLCRHRPQALRAHRHRRPLRQA